MRRTLALTLMFTIASHVASAEPPKEITNSIGMKFKLIPAGEFMMGSSMSPEEQAKAFPETKPHWSVNYRPQHKVRITKPFYLGVTVVTQEQYKKIMGKNPSYFSKSGKGADEVKGMDTSNFPVEMVSWEDAAEFCKKLSAKEGETYRLPTEAEWEYACRAGSTTRYCFGNDEAALMEYSWYGGNSDDRPHPVAQKKSNAWGLYDLHGNVWEWCSDWYDKDHYPKSPTADPTGPVTGSSRVNRGGGWHDDARNCQSWVRSRYQPTSRYIILGFRVARDLSTSKLKSKSSNKPVGGAQTDCR